MNRPNAHRPVLSVTEVTALLHREFPQLQRGGSTYTIEAVGPLTCRLRMTYDDRHLRPGGTISGPSMFALADVSLYVAILSNLGPVALAVTTNLNINFLRKPEPGDLIGDCRLMKLGKRLAVGEVTIRSEGSPLAVAHATGTYSIPPR